VCRGSKARNDVGSEAESIVPVSNDRVATVDDVTGSGGVCALLRRPAHTAARVSIAFPQHVVNAQSCNHCAAHGAWWASLCAPVFAHETFGGRRCSETPGAWFACGMAWALMKGHATRTMHAQGWQQ